ncbi:uncharacterized protein LOC144176013 isoform X1 [Haemaphysalis longicornis]
MKECCLQEQLPTLHSRLLGWACFLGSLVFLALVTAPFTGLCCFRSSCSSEHWACPIQPAAVQCLFTTLHQRCSCPSAARSVQAEPELALHLSTQPVNPRMFRSQCSCFNVSIATWREETSSTVLGRCFFGSVGLTTCFSEGALRPGEPALHVPLLPVRGQPEAPPDAALAAPHGQEALPVRRLPGCLHPQGPPGHPHAQAHGREALPLHPVRPRLQPPAEPRLAHAGAPGAARLLLSTSFLPPGFGLPPPCCC